MKVMCTYCRRVYTNLDDIEQCEKVCLEELRKTWDMPCPKCGESENIEIGICLDPQNNRLAHYHCQKCGRTFGPAKDAGYSLEPFEPSRAIVVIKEV